MVADPSVPIVLKSAFLGTNASLAATGDLPYRTMDGLAGGALLSYPEGTSESLAYQTFGKPAGPGEPTGSELRGTVEAFKAGLDLRDGLFGATLFYPPGWPGLLPGQL